MLEIAYSLFNAKSPLKSMFSSHMFWFVKNSSDSSPQTLWPHPGLNIGQSHANPLSGSEFAMPQFALSDIAGVKPHGLSFRVLTNSSNWNTYVTWRI